MKNCDFDDIGMGCFMLSFAVVFFLVTCCILYMEIKTQSDCKQIATEDFVICLEYEKDAIACGEITSDILRDMGCED